MKNYTCGCLFDYYNYLIQCRGVFFVGVFFVKADRYQKDDVGKTFTFFDQYFYVQICYTCFFDYLKLKSTMQNT